MVQVGTGTVALWEACIEKFNPEVTTEIGSLTKHMEKNGLISTFLTVPELNVTLVLIPG